MSRHVPLCQPGKVSGVHSLALPALLLLHFCLVLYGAAQVFTGNFDSGTVELMATNIANGQDFPLFWYGQTYAGALEAYVAAPFVRLLGPHELVFCLSPILFSTLWVGANYLLFRHLVDRQTGLIAATAAVFSGYYIWYYNFAPSGGYAIILAFGTLILALAVLLARGELSPTREVLVALGMGALAGLGIWVHFFIIPYLLTAALPALSLLIRRRYSRHLLLAYGAALGLCLTGLIPFFLANNHHVGGTGISSFYFTWQHILSSLKTLLSTELLRHMVWSLDFYPPQLQQAILPLLLIALAVLACCTLYVLAEKMTRDRSLLLLLPFIYLLVFLLLFLPHRMSEINSPRYILGFWSTLLICLLAYGLQPLPLLPRLVHLVPKLAAMLWVCHVGLSISAFAQHEHENQIRHVAEKHAILTTSETLGLNHVQMIGGPLYGYGGQSLSALANGKTRFVASLDERFQPFAQSAETDPQLALLAPARTTAQLQDTLALIGAGYQTHHLPNSTIITDIQLPQRSHRLVAASRYRVQLTNQDRGDEQDLRDDDLTSHVRWPQGTQGGITIDFTEPCRLSKLWLQGLPSLPEGSSQGLPTEIRLEYADSDLSWKTILTRDHIDPNLYTQGGRLYFSGYFALCELRFTPITARHLRLTLGGGRQQVLLGELLLFEDQGPRPGMPTTPATDIASLLNQHQVHFTYADRWLSANLLALSPALAAFPRYNPRHAPWTARHTRILIPDRQQALAVDHSLADHTAQLLTATYGPGIISDQIRIGDYSLFFFNDHAAPDLHTALYWNGHQLTKMQDPAWLSRINLFGTDIPVFSALNSPAQGFYRDGWTNGAAKLTRLDCPIPPGARTLHLVCQGRRPGLSPEEVQLKVLINGKLASYVETDQRTLLFRLPPDLNKIESIELHSDTFHPENGDPRALGIDVAYLQVQ